jgi:hypothetical protein
MLNLRRANTAPRASVLDLKCAHGSSGFLGDRNFLPGCRSPG